MEKRLVKLKSFVSLVLVLCVSACVDAEPVERISQKKLSEPEFVRQWLVKNSAMADKDAAKRFFEQGTEYLLKDYWSAAAKAYGESAQLYPDPKTLRVLISSELKMHGKIRGRSKPSNSKGKIILNYALSMYKTILAANTVVHSLTSQEHQDVESTIECLSLYLMKGKSESNCTPLKHYGVSK